MNRLVLNMVKPKNSILPLFLREVGIYYYSRKLFFLEEIKSENPPVFLEDEDILKDDEDLKPGVESGFLSELEMENLELAFVDGVGGGVSLLVIISKEYMDPDSLTLESTYKMLGWADERIYGAVFAYPDSDDEAETDWRTKTDWWNHNSYGYGYYKLRSFYVLLGGFYFG